jgi:hypothetical protein
VADKVYSIDIEAPVQRVWDEVTSVGRVQRHMFDCVLDNNRPGRKYLWHDRPGRRVFVKGQIVESTPPGGGAGGRFVQTFKFTMLPDDFSLVTWEVTPMGPSRTKVTVTHSKLDPNGKTFKQIDGGWPSILKNLRAICEAGQLPLGTRVRYAMMRNMAFMLPKSTLMANHRE